jgi:hypothetical protein
VIIPSTLILPGPQKRIVIAETRNKVAFSPSTKISPPETIKTITIMVIIIGIAANLVNKPRIRKMEQKNSANITRQREVVDPRCIKSINLKRRELNFTSFE